MPGAQPNALTHHAFAKRALLDSEDRLEPTTSTKRSSYYEQHYLYPNPVGHGNTLCCPKPRETTSSPDICFISHCYSNHKLH